MAKMPTTRRGRFEFYRARALRRRKKLRDRRRSVAGLSENSRNERTPVNEWTKQVPPDRYLPPLRGPFTDNYWGLPGHIKPTRGQWPVIRLANFLPWWFTPTHHLEVAMTGFYKRRVKSCPRLKHWRYLPHATPPQPLGSTAYYPFEFYPSGAYNPRWWRNRPGWPPVP